MVRKLKVNHIRHANKFSHPTLDFFDKIVPVKILVYLPKTLYKN
jgi:hypothetical protein